MSDRPTLEEISKVLSIDTESGIITWISCRRKQQNGTRAGWIQDNNYRIIEIEGKRYRAHHLVWLAATGEWPKDEVDHANGERDDNRIANLRAASVSQNRTNRRLQGHNTSGYKWVHWNNQAQRWKAEVNYRKDGLPKKYTSFHKSPEAAYEAAVTFAKAAHGEWFNAGI